MNNLTNISHNNNNFIYILQEECRNNMRENGFSFYDEIICNDKINRFSIDANKQKKDEWYIAFQGVLPSGTIYLIVTYGSWSTGNKYVFKSLDKNKTLSHEERVLVQQKIEEHRMKQREMRKQAIEEAKIEASNIWNNSHQLTSTIKVPYLIAKGLCATQYNHKNLKVGKYYDRDFKKSFNALIVPVQDIYGSLCSLQYIYQDDDGKTHKRFMNKSEKTGNFFIAEDESLSDADNIYITEGVATAISLKLALGNKDVVVSAMDAYNVTSVVAEIKRMYPNKKIYIATDNDDVGQKIAVSCYKMYGTPSIIPSFDNPEYNDWNDYHCLYGIEKMKGIIFEFHNKAQEILNRDLDAVRRIVEGGDPSEDFSLYDLPQLLRTYIQELSKTTDAHPLMLTMSVFGMMSSHFGKKIYFDHHSRLYPNIWSVCVSESGSFKTTALQKGSFIAQRKQSEICEEIFRLKGMSENELKALGHDEESIKNEIIAVSLDNNILPTKCTSEKLLQLLGYGRHGTVYVSEFDAWLQNLTKKHNGDFMGILTDLYDVPGTYINSTKTQGDDVIREPFISIVGVTTLTWLKKSFNTADLEGGFHARIMYFYLKDQNKLPKAHPQQSIDDVTAHNDFESYLNLCLQIIGDKQRCYKFSPEAKRLYGDDTTQEGYFYNIHKIALSYNDNILRPYPNRWAATLIKISMLMQLLIDPETDEISYAALQCAYLYILPAIKSTAFLLEGELTANESDKQIDKLYRWILKKFASTGNPITKRDILWSKQIDGKVKEYDAALDMLKSQERIVEIPGTSQTTIMYKPTIEVK